MSGKLGSGKSTLMTHILDNQRTKQLLSTLVGTCELHLLSYFCWRPGVVLQRSAQGLLRNLLYQLVQRIPDFARTVLDDSSTRNGTTPIWTQRRLVEVLVRVLLAGRTSRFRIFIDGIDECDDEDIEDFLRTISVLSNHDNFKLCVSSRPEARLSSTFSNCPYLRLEELNQLDIFDYVRDSLRGYSSDDAGVETMTELILRRAEGVFLCAALVIQSVLRGLASGDDKQLLLQRIHDTPNEMDAFFSHMLSKVENVHRKSLAFFFRVMQCERLDILHGVDVAKITAAKYEMEIVNFRPFVKACDATAKRLVAQSHGLLGTTTYCTERTLTERAWFVLQDEFEAKQEMSPLALDTTVSTPLGLV